MGLRQSFTEFKPDRSIVRVTMLDGKVIKEKTVQGEKLLHTGGTLNFGIKELKRSGAPAKVVREYKEQMYGKLRTAVEQKLAQGAKK